jgi:hypothetical protein
MYWTVLSVGKKGLSSFNIRSALLHSKLFLRHYYHINDPHKSISSPLLGGKGGRITFLVDPPTIEDIRDSGASPQHLLYAVLL